MWGLTEQQLCEGFGEPELTSNYGNYIKTPDQTADIEKRSLE
jgi:hypothetical protein